MFSLWQDLHFAGRNLRKSPGFAIVAMVTLALGIGASTAIFSVIENVLMEPFPYPEAKHFVSVQIHDTEQNQPGGRAGYSGPEFLDYIAQNHVFDRVIATVRQEIWGTDRSVALTMTGTLEGYISQFSYAGPRFGFLLLGIFASIGLVLVTIGVYSVLAYTAARRTHEIGIRMALGAESGDVLKLVMSMGLRLVILGVGIGLAVSLGVVRIIATQLWGVSPYDAATLIVVPLLLLITGLIACWVPARRAARVDPLVALRYE